MSDGTTHVEPPAASGNVLAVQSDPPTRIGWAQWARQTPRRSQRVGLIGVLMIGIAAAAFTSFSVFFLIRYTNFPPRTAWLHLLIVGSVRFPVIAGFALATFVPLVMRGHLLIRFLTSLASVSLIYAVMVTLTRLTHPFPNRRGFEYWWDVGLLVASYTLGIAIAVVAAQWFSPLQLQFGPRRSVVPPRSMVAELLEFTAIVAVLIAAMRLLPGRTDDIMFVSSISLMLGVGTAGVLWAFLLPMFAEPLARRKQKHVRRIIDGWLATDLIAGVMMAVMLNQGRGPWPSTAVESLVAVGVSGSIIGTATFAFIGGQFVFLRHIGWYRESRGSE